MSKIPVSVHSPLPKTSCTMKEGYLYPIKVIPTLPGDYIEVTVSDVIRSLPMLAPNYGDYSVQIQAYHVDNRLLMDKWWDFRTGGLKNDDTQSLPYMLHSHAKGDVGFGSLTDFLRTAPALSFYTKDEKGVLQPNNIVGKSLCFMERGYTKIINDWMINQNVQEELPLSTENGDDGEDTITNRMLWRKNWNRDYFTNQVPSQQKGPQAIIPIGSAAPVIGNGTTIGFTNGTELFGLASSSIGGAGVLYGSLGNYGVPIGKASVGAAVGSTVTAGLSTDPTKSGMIADLSETTGIPISVINLAKKGQELAVKLMVHGSRSVEFLQSMFGVTSSDARLDRSRFLGSYSTNVLVSPISQTSSTDKTSPQGNQSGIGFHSSILPKFKCYCEEDGFLFIMCCIRPRSIYAQGMPSWCRYKTRNDYPLPLFGNLDFVASDNAEIMYTGVENGTDETDWDNPDLIDNQKFGFHPIYQEYRTLPSEIHGEFLNTLNYWTPARIFENVPKLNNEFLQCNPTRRQWADETENDKWLADFSFKFRLRRKLPKFGMPSYY